MKAWKWARRLGASTNSTSKVHQHGLSAPDPAPHVKALWRLDRLWLAEQALFGWIGRVLKRKAHAFQLVQNGLLRCIVVQISSLYAGEICVLNPSHTA